ncbi:MAG: hypothetical protein QM708_02335 [Propioniciclava sp.]|uniref:hypothetical protein n=1 Tax=Propioniciclava sp. TaxID=2038686 RepID=UPI0039E568CE
MKLFSRNPLPAEFRALLPGSGSSRVLAWARTEDGAVVALHDRLVLIAGTQAAPLGWHDILAGGWDDENQTMRWTRMSTDDRTEVRLTEPNSFPEVFKERVEATFLFQTAVYPRPGKAVTISARRNLTDSDQPLMWTAHPARGVRMDAETIAFVQAELDRLRAEYAF